MRIGPAFIAHTQPAKLFTQANVRSTTWRVKPRWLPCPARRLPTCDLMPRSRKTRQ